jgi:hypothetical protein
LDQEPHKIRLWNGAAYKRGFMERQARRQPHQRCCVGSRLIVLDVGQSRKLRAPFLFAAARRPAMIFFTRSLPKNGPCTAPVSDCNQELAKWLDRVAAKLSTLTSATCAASRHVALGRPPPAERGASPGAAGLTVPGKSHAPLPAPIKRARRDPEPVAAPGLREQHRTRRLRPGSRARETPSCRKLSES